MLSHFDLRRFSARLLFSNVKHWSYCREMTIKEQHSCSANSQKLQRLHLSLSFSTGPTYLPKPAEDVREQRARPLNPCEYHCREFSKYSKMSDLIHQLCSIEANYKSQRKLWCVRHIQTEFLGTLDTHSGCAIHIHVCGAVNHHAWARAPPLPRSIFWFKEKKLLIYVKFPNFGTQVIYVISIRRHAASDSQLPPPCGLDNAYSCCPHRTWPKISCRTYIYIYTTSNFIV